MSRKAASMAILLVASLATLAGRSAQAQAQYPSGSGAPEGYTTAPNGPAEQAMPADYSPLGPAEAETQGPPPPIPPFAEGPAVPAAGGGFCFEGPHPVDSNVEPGVTWDNSPGRHIHPYPPFDLRLFSQQNGCYYFIGDPSDFGYAGETYNYYGAHPILAGYGGGWCFMIGPHRHFWRPWSPLFVTVGPWFYWEGPYDPFFWTYWPYYHFYYRAHYPRYYGHGAFFRGHIVAPRITSVPRPMRSGAAWHGAAGAYRASPMAPRAGVPAAGGGFAPRSNYAPAPRTGGGAHFGGGHFGGHGRH
jgi:hypothetical protein